MTNISSARDALTNIDDPVNQLSEICKGSQTTRHTMSSAKRLKAVKNIFFKGSNMLNITNQKDAEDNLYKVIGDPYDIDYQKETELKRFSIADSKRSDNLRISTSFGRTNNQRKLLTIDNFFMPNSVKFKGQGAPKKSFWKTHIKDQGRQLEEDMNSHTDPRDMSICSKSLTVRDQRFNTSHFSKKGFASRANLSRSKKDDLPQNMTVNLRPPNHPIDRKNTLNHT
jgi:hypothetical protein